MTTAKRSPKPARRAGHRTFLVGDIGGTRTRLALYGETGRKALASAVLSSQEHPSFEDLARAFLNGAGAPRPLAAVLGVAGPVKDRAAAVTNLTWRLDERGLARALRIPRVVLLNDLVVAARGCLHVPPSAVVPLTSRRLRPKGQHLAVIAAGTGLGEARLLWDGARHLAFATEGGHCDFAPRTPLEIELLRFLDARHPGHVSYERVVSGAGLGAVYDFFASRAPAEPPEIAARLAGGDRNATIAEIGLAGAHPPAVQALDLFASIYGAEAGNLVLRELSLGGVFVVGNIARVVLAGREALFLEGLRRKGRFTGMLSEVPVALIGDPLLGLYGALAIAREEAGAG
jgi:glucokinase